VFIVLDDFLNFDQRWMVLKFTYRLARDELSN